MQTKFVTLTLTTRKIAVKPQPAYPSGLFEATITEKQPNGQQNFSQVFGPCTSRSKARTQARRWFRHNFPIKHFIGLTP